MGEGRAGEEEDEIDLSRVVRPRNELDSFIFCETSREVKLGKRDQIYGKTSGKHRENVEKDIESSISYFFLGSRVECHREQQRYHVEVLQVCCRR